MKWLMLLMVVFLVGCSSEVVVEEEIQEEKSIISNLLNNEITEISDDFFPTLDDFELGWEIVEEAESKAEDGFLEAYSKLYQKGGSSLADAFTMENLKIVIYLYSLEEIDNKFNEAKERVDGGEDIYVHTYEDENYECDDDYNCEWVTEEVTEESLVKLSYLKDPNIGDKSIMWSEAMDYGMLGEIKIYYIVFIKDNVYTYITSGSFSSEESIEKCVEYAEFVEKRIK